LHNPIPKKVYIYIIALKTLKINVFFKHRHDR